MKEAPLSIVGSGEYKEIHNIKVKEKEKGQGKKGKKNVEKIVCCPTEDNTICGEMYYFHSTRQYYK